MKVALFIERFDPARGGRERSTAEIAAALAGRGCRVDVVCMAGGDGPAGVNVVPLRTRGLGRTHRFRRFVAAARRRCAAGAYDVTHAMFPLPGADIYQIRGGTLPGLRAAYLRMRGGPAALRRLAWSLNRLRALQGRLEAGVMADGAARILPVSPMVAEEVRAGYGRRAGVRVVLNGVAVPAVDAVQREAWRREVRGQWGLGDGDVAVVCPAVNYELKGVGPLIDAFGRARCRADARALKLIVLGAAPPRALRVCGPRDPVGRRFDSAIDGVHHVSSLSPIWPAYAAADAVVLLSWYDACSRVVLEAVAMGVPCLTTRFNGAADLLADGAGWIVSSPAAGDEVAAALAALADPAARQAAADACGPLGRRVTMERHVDELMEIYAEVMRA
ncbi:MAG: glycosyltransferase family 4 protein [Planctomycetes bacterium]|nr:glycosyltransferase family 4 protein [Planctomycetota bacterium]